MIGSVGGQQRAGSSIITTITNTAAVREAGFVVTGASCTVQAADRRATWGGRIGSEARYDLHVEAGV